MKPLEIEALSFKIIDREAGDHGFSMEKWSIVRRMIHTSADFDYKTTVRFHPDALETGLKAIKTGQKIITDTNMAKAGINKKGLEKFDVEVLCLINDQEIIERAKKAGTTRAGIAGDAFGVDFQNGIYVVGNAPTALLRLMELIRQGRAKPALIVGLPVGFVNAAESKAELVEMDYPYISNAGRKGGSNVAASVINALVKLL